MAIITLMTDFGMKDGNVGVMKGVIWGICPQAQISDLSHMIGAQNVREASLILSRSAPYFPKGTVHVVVVDPGVGTARRPMTAQIGDWFYVGPDNGTITLLLERAKKEGWPCKFVQLDQTKYWLPNVSYVFHGRDIFSPVAAHLANGVLSRTLERNSQTRCDSNSLSLSESTMAGAARSFILIISAMLHRTSASRI